MQEQTVMEIVKWFIGILLVLTLVGVGIFTYQLQDVNSFRQVVNNQIERNGGLTLEAVEQIQEHSNEFYRGRFVVTSPQLHERVTFGDVVYYSIEATFPISFFPIPDVEMSFSGMAVSHVR